VNAKETDEIFELHAEFCKVIANSTRLKIVSLLRDGERGVGWLAQSTGLSMANVSQHLRILRDHHVLVTRKEGKAVYYRLRDPRLVEACELTRSILVGGMNARAALVAGAKAKAPPANPAPRAAAAKVSKPSRSSQRT
jgi:ArsR family transcriptional regulator